MDLIDTLLFIVLFHLVGLIILVISCMAFMLGFLVLYIYVYILFYGKLYRFYGEGL